MRPFTVGLAAAALVFAVSGCNDFKTTDKIMRNEHRIIQNTRIIQRQNEESFVPSDLQRQVIQGNLYGNAIAEVQERPIQQAPQLVPSAGSGLSRIDLSSMSPADVFNLQQALAGRGFQVPLNGVFDVRTAEALVAYQRSIGATGSSTGQQVLRNLGLAG